MKFFIQGGGDSNVGMFPTDSIITIEDNYNWDEDMIKEFKKLIIEFYDNDLEMRNIFTEEEWKKEAEFEKNMEKEMEANDTRNKPNTKTN